MPDSEPVTGAKSAAAGGGHVSDAGEGIHPGAAQELDADVDGPWNHVDGRFISDILDCRSGTGGSGCVWVLAKIDSASSSDLEVAAWLIADAAMRMRCGPSRAYGLWRSAVTTRTAIPDSPDLRTVEPFVRDTFGLPRDPLPENQLEGFVAQLVWHAIMSEAQQSMDGSRRLVRVEDLGFSVLEPGGDGLVIYGDEGGALSFRLWEIKKHAMARHPSVTVARACVQLEERATSYLAKFTGIGKGYEGDLGRLYAQLVDLWVDVDDRAGMGVGIATSEKHAPRRQAFGALRTRFPRFAADSQREGLFAAVADFAAFTQMVRNLVWSAF
jgi:hypothetical protein